MFSSATIEKINYYVYCLVDPRDQNIFYIGKGRGNRVFEHAYGKLKADIMDIHPSMNISSRAILSQKKIEFELSNKIKLIQEIINEGLMPRYYFLRHNIENEELAFNYESLAIDLMSLVRKNQLPLTNLQGGHHSKEKGLMTESEIRRIYEPEPLKTDLPIILITINKEYEKLKKSILNGEINENDWEEQLYERTRVYWKIGERRHKAKYAVAVYRGWTLAVYEIQNWFSAPEVLGGRFGFEGKILDKTSPIYVELVNKLTYSSDENYKAPQNPINYRNC